MPVKLLIGYGFCSTAGARKPGGSVDIQTVLIRARCIVQASAETVLIVHKSGNPDVAGAALHAEASIAPSRRPGNADAIAKAQGAVND